MRKNHDFSLSVKNPYSKHLKKQISLRVEVGTVNYFKELANETGIPYQNLINLYLTDCAYQHKKPALKWA